MNVVIQGVGVTVTADGAIVQPDRLTVAGAGADVTVGSGVGPQGQTGPTGPPGPPTAHVHTQGSASAAWTVNHNLGYRPDVTLYTPGGAEFEAEVVHVSENQVMVYLAVPATGTARCI